MFVLSYEKPSYEKIYYFIFYFNSDTTLRSSKRQNHGHQRKPTFFCKCLLRKNNNGNHFERQWRLCFKHQKNRKLHRLFSVFGIQNIEKENYNNRSPVNCKCYLRRRKY